MSVEHNLGHSDSLHKKFEDFFSATNVILLGMSGSGKTTFVQNLQRLARIRYVSIGEITRSQIDFESNESILGLIQKGGKWPLDVVGQLIKPYLFHDSPVMLDGVPKYPDEAKWLANELAESNYPMTTLTLDIDVKTAILRQNSRDNTRRPETTHQLAERIEVYSENRNKIMDILSPEIDININISDLTPREILQKLASHIILGNKS